MKEVVATIYDLSRMCRTSVDCLKCPLGTCGACFGAIANRPDDVNEKILKWIKEHPVKTRQSEFLKIFPNSKTDCDDIIMIAPCAVEKDRFVKGDLNCPVSHGFETCIECRKEYWLKEVRE